jgi:hypothetical protein
MFVIVKVMAPKCMLQMSASLIRQPLDIPMTVCPIYIIITYAIEEDLSLSSRKV